MVFEKADKDKIAKEKESKKEEKAEEKAQKIEAKEEKAAKPPEKPAEKEKAKEETKAEAKKEQGKEEAPKKEAKEEKTAAPSEAKPEEKAEEKVIQIEKFYIDNKLKNGDVYLKRKKNKPRFRKITAKNHQAQLFFRFKGEWVQMSALHKNRVKKNLRWHLRNKWQKTDQAKAEK